MPTYDYRCPGCASDFSAFVPMSKRDTVVCPDCGCEEPRQKVTTFHRSGSAAGEGACSSKSCAACSGCR